MTAIEQLNNLERKLRSFGINPQPRQDKHGRITLPVRYSGDGFNATLSAHGGTPTEQWRGNCSQHIRKRICEHFQAFLTVDAL